MSTIQDFVAYAQQWVGITPYVFGGESLVTGTDCSGYEVLCAAHFGVTLPRTTQGMWDSLEHLGSPEYGCLISFDVPSDGPPQPQHTGIYLGPNLMVSAPHTGTFVQYSTIPNEPDISILGYLKVPGFDPAPAPITYPSPLFEELAMDPMFAVRYLYRICLKREVDPAGFTTWVDFLSGGGSLNDFMAALQDSPEGKAVLAGTIRSGI